MAPDYALNTQPEPSRDNCGRIKKKQVEITADLNTPFPAPRQDFVVGKFPCLVFFGPKSWEEIIDLVYVRPPPEGECVAAKGVRVLF